MALADGESGVKVCPATSLSSWVTLGRSLDSPSAGKTSLVKWSLYLLLCLPHEDVGRVELEELR